MQLQGHRRRRGLGALTLNQLNPTQQSAISAFAGEAGISGQQAAGYAAMLQNDSVAVSNAITALQKGNAVTALKDAAPVIGGAISLVNPVAGAIVGGVLEIVGLVLSAIGIDQQPQEECQWKWPPTPSGRFGACFTNQSRPYGPSSSEWVSLQTFASSFSNPTNPWIDVYWHPEYPHPSWLDDTLGNQGTAFGDAYLAPGFLLGPELAILGDQGPVAQWWKSNGSSLIRPATSLPTTKIGLQPRSFWSGGILSRVPSATQWRWTTPGLQAFALVFNRVWASACEYPINGWQMPQSGGGPNALLNFTAQAWNAVYPAGTPVTIDGSLASDGFYKSFADAVVAGQVDQWVSQSSVAQQNPSVVVNDPTGFTQSPLSPTTFLVGAAGAATLGTLGYALLTKQSVGSVLRGILGAVPKVVR